MPRYARLIVENKETIYHIVSRTALDGFPFGAYEKDEFVKIMKSNIPGSFQIYPSCTIVFTKNSITCLI